jgi:hypothetical protein
VPHVVALLYPHAQQNKISVLTLGWASMTEG